MASEKMRTVLFHGREITYRLTRKPVKNVNLRVKADGSIAVSANTRVSEARIDTFVLKNAERILQAAETLKQRSDRQKHAISLVTGEEICLFGTGYRLEVFLGEQNRMRKRESYLLMETRDPEDAALKQAIFDRFLKETATETFEELLQEYYPLFQKDCGSLPHLRVRSMKTRWGSCTPQNNSITLNLRLAFAPLSCSRYVLLHEYCHFRVPNHSDDFYRELSGVCPAWKEEKRKLEESGA